MKVLFIKSFLFCVVFFHFHHFGFSQNDMSKNKLYLELLGKGFFYSVNYERNAVQFNDLIGLNLSTGIGIFPGLTSLEKSILAGAVDCRLLAEIATEILSVSSLLLAAQIPDNVGWLTGSPLDLTPLKPNDFDAPTSIFPFQLWFFNW